MKILKQTILILAYFMITSLNAAWTSSSSADWETTANSIVISGNPGLTLDPSSVIDDLDAYILEEGLFKTKLQSEQSENEQNLVDNQNSLVDATTALQDAQTNFTNATTLSNAAADSLDTALASESSLQTSYNNATADVADILSDDPSIDVNDASTHTQSYIDAIAAESTAKVAYDAAVLQTANALVLNDDANLALNTANSGVADAQNTVDALNTTRSTLQQRTVILQTEIQNIDNRVIDADNAKTTISNAFVSKGESFTDIITLVNSLVDNDFSEDLEASLDTLANTPTNDLDNINPVETTINGSVLDHNNEDNLTNVVLSEYTPNVTVSEIINDYNDLLDSTTAIISDQDVSNILDTLSNGAFERNAISDIYANGVDGIVSVGENGEIRLGENSFVTNEVGGVQQMYAEDATNSPIDLDVTNGSNLLINGDAVATESYADSADTAQSTALTTAFTDADTVLDGKISINSADIAVNRDGIAMAAAISHSTILPGKTQALDIAHASFEGSSAMSINYSRKVAEGIQINLSHASAGDSHISKVGVGLQW